MKVKFFCIPTVMSLLLSCLVLTRINKAHGINSILFKDNGKCLINCNNEEYLLESINTFSELSNCLLKQYFTVDSIVKLPDNNILFYNFNTTNDNFTLSIAADNRFILKNLIFDCCDNKVNFPVMHCLYNISNIYIYSDLPNNEITFPISMVSPDVISKFYLNDKSIV